LRILSIRFTGQPFNIRLILSGIPETLHPYQIFPARHKHHTGFRLRLDGTSDDFPMPRFTRYKNFNTPSHGAEVNGISRKAGFGGKSPDSNFGYALERA